MTLWNLLIIILFLSLLGAIPIWPHSANWGYAPGSVISLILIIILILMLLGRI